jgi:hypothetical protein
MLYVLLLIMISLNGIAVNDMDLGRRMPLISDTVGTKQKSSPPQNGANAA